MFLVNSRFPLLSAAIPRSTRKGASRVRPPFSRSYGGNLPSSLTTVHPSPRYSLPDHLCRFGVRAAGNSLEAFLGSIGSSTSPNRLGITSHPRAPRICLWCGLHAYPGTTTGRAQLPSCVTPSLTYDPPGPHRHPTGSPKATDRTRRLAQWGSALGAPPRVREYQPVLHRLRLSASP